MKKKPEPNAFGDTNYPDINAEVIRLRAVVERLRAVVRAADEEPFYSGYRKVRDALEPGDL